MKPTTTTRLTKWLAAFVASATLAGSNSLPAQTWETILPSPDFAPVWTGYSALIDPFPADPSNPGVFAGYASNASGEGSVLRLDPNGPSLYSASVVDSDLERVYRLGYNALSQTLYAVGARPRVTEPPFPRFNYDVWQVRKSSTGGDLGTWITDDTFYLSTKASASARGITADAQGNVYVCGTATLNSSAHWIVRKFAVGDTQWRTVSDLSGQGDSIAIANGMSFFRGNASNPKPALFAVGILNYKWTVLRSQDQGANWVSVDSWSPGSKAAATAFKAACDKDGNIFVVGCRGTFNAPRGWVVRMSANGGDPGSWNPVLDFSEGAYSVAIDVAADEVGNVWVSGFTQNTSGTSRWTVVRHSPSESWSQSWISRSLPFGENYSKARGIATDASGNNVFVTGELGWTDGTSHVAVQRLLPPPLP